MDLRLIDITDEYDHEGIETYMYDIYVGEIDRYVGRCEYRNESGIDLEYYGNVGYVIYPPYRGHNFAFHACSKMFEVITMRKKGLHEVLITCNPDNVPSQKTIQRLGGLYLRTVDVSPNHELFELGETSKEIYKVKI